MLQLEDKTKNPKSCSKGANIDRKARLPWLSKVPRIPSFMDNNDGPHAMHEKDAKLGLLVCT